MGRYFVLSALAIYALISGASTVNAEPLITVNGLNPVESPLTIEGTDQILLAVEGNSPTEPNNLSITASGGTLQPVEDVNQQYLLDFNDGTAAAIVSLIANNDIIIEEKSVSQ
jgi:hypothetical protein